MKKNLIALIVLLLSTLYPIHTYALSDALSNNCILINKKYFDSCPKYRKQVRMINEVLYQDWTAKEQTVLGKNEMAKEVESMEKKLKIVNAELFKSGQRTEEKAFFIGYMIEIMKLYREELESGGSVIGKADSLFSKTYFNQEQEGLVITAMRLQEDAKRVLQFDAKVHLALDIRNFMSTVVTQVEDIYCFASLGKEDFIFPLNSPIKLFESNSIKSINISLETANHPLLQSAGQQTIYCTMVYFNEKAMEEQTPYAPFTFTVQEA